MNTKVKRGRPSKILQSVMNDSASIGEALGNLAHVMKSVNTDSQEAKLNASSIEDNNGKRIELNRELKNQNSIKK